MQLLTCAFLLAQCAIAQIVVQNTTAADVPVTPGAVQPKFGGGTCVYIGFHNSSTGPCSDIYVAKYSADDGRLLLGTYLGGTGAEQLVAFNEEADGSVVVLGTSASTDFLGAGQGFNAFVLRLSPAFDRIAASQRLDKDLYPSHITKAGDTYLLGGGMPSVVYGVRASDLAPRWKTPLPAAPTSYIRAMTQLTGGDAAVSALFQSGAEYKSTLFRLRPLDGALLATRVIDGRSDVMTLAALPDDSLVAGGVLYPRSFSIDPTGGTGFIQRFDPAIEAVEAPQKLGYRITRLLTDAAGLIGIWGDSSAGLPTTLDAPFRCHSDATDNFYAELPYAQGSPSFVSYLGKPSQKPLPTSGQPACIEARVQSYALTLDRGTFPQWNGTYERHDVAAGELLTIFGSGFADREIRFQPEQTGLIPREAEGTRFLVNGEAVGIVAVGPNQATIAMPQSISGKETVEVVLDRNGTQSAPLTLSVVKSAPTQVVAVSNTGDRYGVYLNGVVSSPDHLVKAGDEVTVYLVGGGALDRALDETRVVGDGELPRAANQVQAFVEGVGYQPVLYAGAVRGELPGLMQVNVRINSDLIYYGRLTLTIVVGGRETSSTFWEQQP